MGEISGPTVRGANARPPMPHDTKGTSGKSGMNGAKRRRIKLAVCQACGAKAQLEAEAKERR